MKIITIKQDSNGGDHGDIATITEVRHGADLFAVCAAARESARPFSGLVFAVDASDRDHDTMAVGDRIHMDAGHNGAHAVHRDDVTMGGAYSIRCAEAPFGVWA